MGESAVHRFRIFCRAVKIRLVGSVLGGIVKDDLAILSEFTRIVGELTFDRLFGHGHDTFELCSTKSRINIVKGKHSSSNRSRGSCSPESKLVTMLPVEGVIIADSNLCPGASHLHGNRIFHDACHRIFPVARNTEKRHGKHHHMYESYIHPTVIFHICRHRTDLLSWSHKHPHRSRPQKSQAGRGHLPYTAS